MLLSSTNSGGVCIIGTRCGRSGRTTAFCVITRTVGALVKEPTIAGAIFLRVPLEAYFRGGGRQITSCMNISAIMGVCIPGGSGYQQILFELMI